MTDPISISPRPIQRNKRSTVPHWARSIFYMEFNVRGDRENQA